MKNMRKLIAAILVAVCLCACVAAAETVQSPTKPVAVVEQIATTVPAPAQPETPAAPTTPAQPETPATPSVPTTTVPDVEVPKTGASVVALGVMALVSLTGAVISKKH